MWEVFALHSAGKKEQVESKLLNKSLTRREMEVAVSILSDQTYKEIGDELFIAEGTVSKHASNVFKKTGVKDRNHFLSKFREESN